MSSARGRCAPSTWDLPFFFDSGHHELAEQARRVALKVLGPQEDALGADSGLTPGGDLAREREHCLGIARVLADARLLEACVPGRDGGMALGGAADTVDSRALCLVREMLGWASGMADLVFAMQGLGSYPIALAGDAAQRAEFLPDVLAGRALAAFAITEHEAGSDVAAMSTVARRDGEHYVITGRKTLISNAGVAGHYVVFANARPDLGRKGITAFVVRPDDPGFVFEESLPLIAPHPIGTIRFDELRLPASRRLGAEGDGLKIALATLDVFRPTVGAAALGMARRALDEALARVTTRKQFGQALAEFQTTQFYLAEMATELDAARLLVFRAAHVRDHGAPRVTLEASMAKMFATESAQRVIDRALQLHGGAGVVRGAAVERLYREVRALRIYEGTTEIQRLVIASQLLAGERARVAEEQQRAAEQRADDVAERRVAPSADVTVRLRTQPPAKPE